MLNLHEYAVPGIFIDTQIRSREDKEKARNSLYGFKRAEIPIDRWMDCHKAGCVFVPGDMRSFYDADWQKQRYSHREALWNGTIWVVLDLDRDDDKVPHVHEPSALTIADPNAENLLYGACESVSSLVGHRGARWHGFVLFERIIETRQEFDAIMHGLQAQLRFMTGAGSRQPAQPVYGNAREGCYSEIFESVIRKKQMTDLANIGYDLFPQLRTERIQARDCGAVQTGGGGRVHKVRQTNYDIVADVQLRTFFIDYGIPIYDGSKYHVGGALEIHYTPCPFGHWHSETTDGATDAFITIHAETGKWGFKCFHEHCRDRDWQDFKAAMTCPVRGALRSVNVSYAFVEHHPKARVYRHVKCPICFGNGDALFVHETQVPAFTCESQQDICGPILIQEYMERWRNLGGSESCAT